MAHARSHPPLPNRCHISSATPRRFKPTACKIPPAGSIDRLSLKQAVDSLLQQDSRVDAPTLARLIRGCGNARALAEGKRVHELVQKSSNEGSVFLTNLLVTMYGKCGSLDDARRVFEQMPERNLISWNSIIASHARAGESRGALGFFTRMLKHGVRPDRVSFLSVLTAFSGAEDLRYGRLIHASVLDLGYGEDLLVGNALISMYGKCQSLADARAAFDAAHKRDVVTWNAMISAFAQNDRGEEAIGLFDQMLASGMTPDDVTMVSVVDACASSENLDRGKQIHALISETASQAPLILANALINLYARCGDPSEAKRIFDNLPNRNVVSWTTMIGAYARRGDKTEALKLLKRMRIEGVDPNKVTYVKILEAFSDPADLADGKSIHSDILRSGFRSDVVVQTALVNMYANCGCPDGARRVFDRMPLRDEIAWNSMIAAYAGPGYGRKAVELFQQMQKQGVNPSVVTYISVLDACADAAALREGKLIHERIRERGFGDEIVLGNALINMYAKSGSLAEARAVFDSMKIRDAVSWTTIIAAYAQHGHGRATLELFREMLLAAWKPNEITFISVLSACNHAGLVDEGLFHFESMAAVHGLSPTMEHYGCIIDLLGRAGWLQKAEDLILTMPIHPDRVIWTSLLAACRVHGDVDRGKRVAKRLLESDSNSDAPHLLL